MQITHLSDSVNIKTISEDHKSGVFEIEGLYAGYGLTLGNALRRTLMSSLPGAAVTYIKIKNASHEFTMLPGVKEDLVEIMLNFKKLRFEMHIDEPQVLSLKVKGEKEVTGADIKETSDVKVINKNEVLATVTDSKAEFDVEITVERGLGYSAVESRKAEKLAVGVIAVDALFSPVVKVNYTIENMRVGDRTDYNRLRLEIGTDGTVSPSSALHKSANILKDHFEKVFGVLVQGFEESSEKVEEAPKKRGRPKRQSPE
jgi:DNA-directed RNA polymerase subunit alpha